MIKVNILIEGMHCEHCAKKVTDALLTIEGVKKVKINLAKKQAIVTMQEDVDKKLLTNKIEELDYQVVSID